MKSYSFAGARREADDAAPPGLSCRFCRKVSPPAAKFCMDCGSPFALQPCWACDAVNAAEARACHACGADLALDGEPDLDAALAKIATLQRVHARGGEAGKAPMACTDVNEVAPAGRQARELAAEATTAFVGEPASRGLKRSVLGRRAQRPVLATIAAAMLAVPYLLTVVLREPPTRSPEADSALAAHAVPAATTAMAPSASAGGVSLPGMAMPSVPLAGPEAVGAEEADGAAAAAADPAAVPARPSSRGQDAVGGRNDAAVKAPSPRKREAAADAKSDRPRAVKPVVRGTERAKAMRAAPAPVASRKAAPTAPPAAAAVPARAALPGTRAPGSPAALVPVRATAAVARESPGPGRRVRARESPDRCVRPASVLAGCVPGA